jgi:arylsulfatase A-like enzyme
VTPLLLLLGCHQERAARLERRIEDLTAETGRLQAEAARLLATIEKFPPPTATVRVDRVLPGFDRDRPLPAGDPSRPDVIVLSIDTLRADHLGAYGYGRDTSPFLDRLGAEGTVFEQAWSPTSWTLPTHVTMLSGQLPVTHGTIDDHLRIAADVPLVQEAFRRAGYGTTGVVGTLFVSSRYGFERGFDRFVDFGISSKQENNRSTVQADQVFDQALYEVGSTPPGEAQFVFLHVYDVHYQYDPPPPWNEKFDRAPRWGDEVYRRYEYYLNRMVPRDQLDHQVAQYDEEIAFVDDSFRRFVEKWRGDGREAIVVVTADHGEEFGERGSWGHAHTLWPEQLHVPLIVNGPGVATQRIAARAGTEDIAPTIAALAQAPFASALDGVDRSAQILTGAAAPPDATSARFAETSRFETLTYRWHEGTYDLQADLAHGARALCDVAADPKCEVNIYKGNRELAEAMFGRMMDWLGADWKAARAGRVEIEIGTGIAWMDGARKVDALVVEAGDDFQVEPGDAIVRFVPAGDERRSFGPWRPLGGTVPGGGCPVSFDGRYTVDAELPELTDDERDLLEQLGYVTEDPGTADAGLGPSGPERCRP